MEPKTRAAAEEKLVQQLCSELTCACALAHPVPAHSAQPPTDGAGAQPSTDGAGAHPPTAGAQPPIDGACAVVTDNHPAPVVTNLSPTAFLATLRQAAVDASSVIGEFAQARLLSFSRAFARGWGPAGPGRYERRSVQELVDDKIYPDLNLPAEDDPEEALERRRKRNVSSSNLVGADGAIAGPSKRMRNQCLSPPYIIDLDPEDDELAGSKVAAAAAEDSAPKQAATLGEEQDPLQADGGSQTATVNDGADGAAPMQIQAAISGEDQHIRKRLEELISKVEHQATRPFPGHYRGKLNWFRSQVTKYRGSAVETSGNVGGSLSGQPASRYYDAGTVGASELQSHMNVTSAQPEERRPEIGTEAIAATMPQQEQNQEDGRPRLSQAEIMKRVDELVSKVKNQTSRPRPLPKHYLGKLYWFRSQVAKDHGSAVDTSANISSALSNPPASDEGTVGETELPSQMNVASAQPEEKMPEIGTSTIAGGLSPMHEDGGMSSQPAAGNEDRESEDVHAVPGSNASLQEMVSDVIPTIPQTSPAREGQLGIASPRGEPDDLDGVHNDLDEMQPGPSSSASVPP
ncbi:uncharacterized protein LOC123441076 [Hordeum vulgare subsp. vulgare]|uniref:uncharacterized protein LOC123441076 n=1 Tax=Hordeum vulgare subsp. vulgare TaxID=112509 RepID=UPI001D1A4867|nr:uncharacterized protein LOC123441076 [Hordeum vulgare subsp. vulgare]